MTNQTKDYMGMGETSLADTATWDDGPKVVTMPRNHPLAASPVGGGGGGIMAMLGSPPSQRDPKALDAAAKRIGHQFGGTLDAQGKSRAIYSFPAGQSNIEGATVWLIEALLQAYGHCAAEMHIEEDARDPNRVTITSTVVDFVNSVVYRRPHVASLAPAPARFASKPDQVERWRSMQMQSAISKAGRTAMQHALPAWYVDTAISAAREAMSSKLLVDRNGKRTTLKAALDTAVAWYEDVQGVSVQELEALVEAERPMWTLSELAYLKEVSLRLARGETTKAEVFGNIDAPPPATAPTTDAPKDDVATGLSSLSTPKAAASKTADPAKPADPAKAADAKPADPAKADTKTAKAKDGGLI